MKTITLSIAFILCVFISKAQLELCSSAPTNNFNSDTQQFCPQEKLKPVYFNFHRRQLKDSNKNKIDPMEFLNLCRTIKDSTIQLQIARYDAFTKDKERLSVLVLGSGFATMGLLGGAGASAVGGSQDNYVITRSLLYLGIMSLIAIPVTAIYSSVPHQKRKSVLFRDLPIAYNQYVESHP